MVLYFPLWLAYVAYALMLASILWLAILLLCKTVNTSIDFIAKTFKITRAFIAFLLHREARREFGTIAEIRESMEKEAEKHRREAGQLRYRERWALWHLYLATGGMVGVPCHISYEGDEKHDWAEYGWKTCAQMQAEFDAWLAERVEQEKAVEGS